MSISQIGSWVCAIGAIITFIILIWGNNDN